MSNSRKSFLTSVLPRDEIDPVAELDLEAAVAHEILQADSRNDSRLPFRRVHGKKPSDYGACAVKPAKTQFIAGPTIDLAANLDHF